MLEDFSNGSKMRFSTERYMTEWINLEVGISIGCTISPILFVLAMGVILRAAEESANPPDLDCGCYMPPLKAFVDDTTILCSKENKTLRMLLRLDALMNWIRMSFKQKKFRRLSIRKSKLDEDVYFKVASQDISRPITSLGRWYDSSLKDTKRGSEALQQASVGLQAIYKCGLPGKYRMWCLQFLLIPKPL
ncbi:reverse transcriptase [Plakobranchus ocellatus]|uniref:Reverse transcriptase n=1 Tax=Plakobranchus ocellatus TaxID=259542 RepID=A0AAV4DSZ0_9GAST|nr:reverse transcriptase [Plakobranchus ocellatus]